MQHATLDAAIAEARRFLERAEAATKAMVEEVIDKAQWNAAVGGNSPDQHRAWNAIRWANRERATALRASMDLTRILADLRQNR